MAAVSLEDVKAHGNITSTANDDELGLFIDTAQELIEGYIGVIVPRTVTETLCAYERTVQLKYAPVLTVASVTEYGGTVGAGLYLLDPAYGTLVRTDGRGWYAAPSYPLVITYQAGRMPVAASIRWAIMELTITLWRGTQAQRGGRGRGEAPDAPTGYALPNRVREILDPFILIPAVG